MEITLQPLVLMSVYIFSVGMVIRSMTITMHLAGGPKFSQSFRVLGGSLLMDNFEIVCIYAIC